MIMWCCCVDAGNECNSRSGNDKNYDGNNYKGCVNDGGGANNNSGRVIMLILTTIVFVVIIV